MRIKCEDCVNECDRKCGVKNTTINPGKHRKCTQFEFDTVRELMRLKKSAAIRDRYDARQAAYRELLVGQKVKKADNTNVKYPVTGNLDRFKTTKNS